MNQDEILKRFEQLNKPKGDGKNGPDSDGITWYKPKDGSNVIRFLPALNSDDLFFLEFLMHYKVGPAQKTFPCLRNVGEDCPACALVRGLYEKDDPQSREIANSIRAKHHYRANIIDLNDLTKGVQLYDFGPTVYESLINIMSDAEVRDISNPNTGRAINLIKTGTGINTSYALSPKMSVHVLEPQWIGKGYNLANSVLKKLVNREMIEKILIGDVEDTKPSYHAPLKKYIDSSTTTTAVTQTPTETTAVPTPTSVVAEAPAPTTTPTVTTPVAVPVVEQAISTPTATSFVANTTEVVQAVPLPVTPPVTATATVASPVAAVADNDIMAKIQALKVKNQIK
jgi:hypothetical protein